MLKLIVLLLNRLNLSIHQLSFLLLLTVIHLIDCKCYYDGINVGRTKFGGGHALYLCLILHTLCIHNTHTHTGRGDVYVFP